LAFVLFADADRTSMLLKVRTFDVEATMYVEYEGLINRTIRTIVFHASTSSLDPETHMLTTPNSVRHALWLASRIGTLNQLK
jgi:hypothetical protein